MPQAVARVDEIPVILAGAAPDTGNLGVSALCHSAVSGLSRENSNLKIYVVDHGSGVRPDSYTTLDGKKHALLGARHSRRFIQQSAYINIRTSIKLGPLATPVARVFRSSRAVLDLSGGDSFSDLYGKHRFDTVMQPKRTAIANGIPLILLPQTYGPFKEPATKAAARQAILEARLSYARDVYSYQYLMDLLGSAFDPDIHKLGVDHAFLLPTAARAATSGDTASSTGEPSSRETFGLNVSGLIYNDADHAAKRYGISIDYREALKRLVAALLQESDGEIVLIPHVLTSNPDESDEIACKHFKSTLPESQQRRIRVIECTYDECEVKGVISRCSWFCGTRMHATIASLSNAIPTATIAYSGKARGVFQSAGQEDKVLDARSETTEDIVGKLVELWRRRKQTGEELAVKIPEVKQRAQHQLQDIVAHIP